VSYDIDGTPVTTAGLTNSTITPFSIAEYLGSNCSIFALVYLSNASEITDFRFRIGVDGANYYEMIAVATHANTEFVAGWNVLRFDLSTRTEVGTVNDNNIMFVQCHMTKLATKINQSGFRMDHFVISEGDIFEVRYYSRYGWKSAAGIWLENSTEDDDFVIADTDEFELFVDKGIQVAGEEVDEMSASQSAYIRYDRRRSEYLRNNPSEALIETSDYQAQYYI
jgi:hypothetical protein